MNLDPFYLGIGDELSNFEIPNLKLIFGSACTMQLYESDRNLKMRKLWLGTIFSYSVKNSS